MPRESNVCFREMTMETSMADMRRKAAVRLAGERESAVGR